MLRPIQHGVGRRALLAGVVSSFAATVQQPAVAAGERERLDGIIDRAKSNSLTTDNVIYRAMSDSLVEPDEIDGCRTLEAIYNVDIKAANEVRVTNEAMMKLNAAARETGRRSLNGNNPDSFKDSYEIGRLVEQRIRERASLINFKLARECNDNLEDKVERGEQGRYSSNERSRDERSRDERSREEFKDYETKGKSSRERNGDQFYDYNTGKWRTNRT